MTTKQTAAIPQLGFLVFEKTVKKDGYISALMVTDNRGYPLEFRATTPVRPSVVQKALYGNQLDHYVGVELCAKPLVQQSQRKPKVILVPDVWLLDVADEAIVNIIAVWRAGESMKLQQDESKEVYRTIKSSVSTYKPLIYKGRFMSADQEKDSIAFVEECHQHFDLAEAFERIRASLALLGKEDPRYA